MVTCGSCGAEITENTASCPDCGAEIKAEVKGKQQEQPQGASSGLQMPDRFTVLRWVFINIPYAFAGLLVGIYYYYIRDYGQGLGTIFGLGAFVLLFVVPFYIGEAAKKVRSPLNIPVRFLHFFTVTGVQMVFAFLIVLTMLVKDHVDPAALPETPVSERLEGTPGLPEEEWPLAPETEPTTPDEHIPDSPEALDPSQDDVEAVDGVESEDAARHFFLFVLDHAELSLAIVNSDELSRFPLQTFFSALAGIVFGLISWVTFKKRPWRIKFREVKYEEPDEFRLPM